MRRISIACIVVLATTAAVASGAMLIAPGISRLARPAARTLDGTRTAYLSLPDRAYRAHRALTFLFGMRTVQARKDQSAAGSVEAFAVRDRTTGMASAITVYVDAHSGASRLLVALYSNRDGRPGLRLATGSLARPRHGAWNTIYVSRTPVQAGRRYWFAFMGKGGPLSLRTTPRGHCGAGGSGPAKHTGSSLPVSWTGGGPREACAMSAYVSGTPFGPTFGPIITGTPAGGSPTVSAGPPSNTSPPSSTSAPLVTGIAQQGDLLSASTGIWPGIPLINFSYQWQDCSEGSCANIPGATSSTYLLQSSDVGYTIDVIVTAQTAAGSASATSAQTAIVASQLGLYTLPADRTFGWNPGLSAVGGIPNRTSIYETISPSGGDDTATIQAALNSCPVDGVVQLTAGVFNISGNGLSMENSYCTLRGVGPGPGTLPAGTAPSAGTTTGTYLVKAKGSNYPVAIIGPRWEETASSTVNLTANAVRGTNTATVASASGLAAGDLVVVDEENGNTTVASGSNGVNVNTFTGSGTLNVASTANFNSPGEIEVVTSGGNAVLTCTGTAGGVLFTGCTFTSGQAGTVSTGNAVLDTTVSHWNSQDPENGSGWFEEPNRPLGDVMEIASISGNTLTFTTDFPITYQVAESAHLYQVRNMVKYSGIEDLYVYGGEGGDGGGGIHLFNCAYCWVKHVEDTWQVGSAIEVDDGFRDEIRDSYFHDSQDGLEQGGGSYGIDLSWYTSNTLVENNISIRFNKVDVMRSAGGGNVFGYNYLDDGADNGGSWFETNLNSTHMTTPHYELFEGNEAANFDQDDRWGNSIDITVFRNQLIGQLRDYPNSGPQRAAGVTQWQLSQSFVGNVLGAPGETWAKGYEAISPASGNWGRTMWMVCWQNNDDVPDGGKCLSTLLRDGNYDYFTHEVHWHGIGGTGVNNGLTPPANHTLPASMYLTSKPAFFGSATWPWVDGSSASNPLPGQLPARARYDAGTPNAVQ